MSSTAPALYVTTEISSQAQILISAGTGSSIRDGIELLLSNGVANSRESFTTNAGLLLQRGLTILSNSPNVALDISSNPDLVDVKKAYKRMALKYHPDKNPSTTPLFHVIHGAYEKLMNNNRVDRSSIPEPTKPTAAASPTKPKKSSASHHTTESTSSTNEPSQSSSSTPSNHFRQYQTKPNKFTSYRTSSEETYSFSSEKQESKSTPSSQKWAYASKSDMAGDNDPLPGQNTYEGFRGYSQYPNANMQPDSTKQNSFRRKSDSSLNSSGTTSTTETNHQTDDIKKRSQRRQEEYDAANKRIAERRARQQARRNQDDETEISKHPKTKSRKGSKDSKDSKFQQSISLPIPSNVSVKLSTDSSSSSSAAVDIKWDKYSTTKSSLLKVELSWKISPLKQSNSSWKTGQSKSQEQTTDWVVSSQLIKANSVRKKNLVLGSKYEFRLRYVQMKAEEDSSSSDEYQRGEWSNIVSIPIPMPTSTSTPIQADIGTMKTFHEISSSDLEIKYTIEINEIRAKGLCSRTLFGISNPYVACTIAGIRYKTGVISHTNEPNWMNEKITFYDVSLRESLHVEIFDKELISRKSLLGEIYIPLSDLKMNDIRNWMILTGGSSEESEGISEVHLSIHGNPDNQRVNKNNEGEKTITVEKNETGFTSDTENTSHFTYYQLVPPKSFTKSLKEFFLPVYHQSAVFSESSSPIIGYLTPLKYVLVDTHQLIENWICVQCHYQADDQTKLLKSPLWGWCEKSQQHHTYFLPISIDYEFQNQNQSSFLSMDVPDETNENDSEENDDDSDDQEDNDNEDDQIPVWYQLCDESTGYYYYYNDSTGESEWEPPEWIEELDPISGSRYYVHLNAEDGSPIETTWSKPNSFCRLVREMSK